MEQTVYHPKSHTLDQINQVTLVAVIGPTAVGKSTLIAAATAREPRINLVITHTSRDPRPGERDGVDYIFCSREAMLADMEQGAFVQVAPTVFGDLYATKPESYRSDGVATMAILADAMPSFRALPFRLVRSIFVLPPDYATWRARIERHGFDTTRLKSRLIEAERSLVYAAEDEPTQFIINDSVEQAADDFVTLALGKKCPLRLLADQSRAREIVRNLLDELRGSLQDL